MRAITALALICALGCGDDDGGTDAGTDTGTDVGDMDTGGEDAPVDANVETTTVRMRYLDVDEAPLADVKLRFDTAAGPAEGVTGSDGVVVIDVPAAVGEDVTITAALEGYVIVTGYELPLPVEITGDTPFDATLFEISPDTPAMFRVNATGVPTDGRFCVSFDGWSLCNLSDTDWSYQVPPANIGEFANCWLLDDTDTPIDFERVAIPDGATSLDVTFDGSFDTEPTTRTVTIEVPADGGPMLTFDVDEPNISLWHGWFQLIDSDTQQMWSVATNLQRDGDNLTVDVAEVPPPDGVESRYATRIFSSLGSFLGSNFAIYVTDPGATASTMGLSLRRR